MANMQKKILKRAKAVPKPAKKAAKQGARKLRLGYIVAPIPLIERIAAHRSLIDTQGDQVLEYADTMATKASPASWAPNAGPVLSRPT